MTALESQLAEIVAQLHDQGIDVTARLDERRRVCVRATCACTDRDHRRVMAAFLAITSAVAWEAAGPAETEVQPQGQATVPVGSGTAGGDA